MKKLFMIALCLCCIVPAQANAANFSGIYIAPKFVHSFVGTEVSSINTNKVDSKDSAFGVALAGGYNFEMVFGIPIRTELEWNMHSQTEDSGRITVAGIGNPNFTTNIGIQTLFLNVYYDFHNVSRFTPYIGAGLGATFVDVESSLSDQGNHTLSEESTTNFAWNVNLGVSYDFTTNLALDISYRYAQFGKGETTRSTFTGTDLLIKTDTISAHQGILALRYTF